MPEIQRGLMVQCIIGAMGIFPHIDSPCVEKNAECKGCLKADTFLPHYNLDEELTARILLKYENRLLDWIVWAPSNTDLAFTYGFMKSTPAKRRFASLLDLLSPSAIQFSWEYNKYPSIAMLKSLLYYFNDKEPYQTMLRLMLSESGDDESYALLKKNMNSQWYELLLDEALRRKDFTWIYDEANKFTAMPEITGGPVPLYQKLSLFWKALSLLMKYDPEDGMRIVQTINLTRDIYRDSVIEACIKAKNANCESALKFTAPLYDALRLELRGDWQKRQKWERWISALQATNTAWCRDQIVQNADYLEQRIFAVLASMNDQRAISLSQTPETYSKHLLHWMDALKLGAIEIAANHPELNQENQLQELSAFSINRQYVYTLFSKPISPVDLLQWTPEQIQCAHKELILKYNTLPSNVRFELVRRIGSSCILWSDDLIIQALRDSYPPVRIAMLSILRFYPHSSVLLEIRTISIHDSISWCRRLATEILLSNHPGSDLN
jgi:hypothetical protein